MLFSGVGPRAPSQAALYGDRHDRGPGDPDHAHRGRQHGNLLSGVVGEIRETARGLRLGRGTTFLLTLNESKYALVSTYLFGFGRSMAEVGAVSMVGGAIAYKTNVMSTAIMMYTNMGDFTLGLALGVLLLGVSLIVNVIAHLLQGRRA
jgi:tungstate transport system permease protein